MILIILAVAVLLIILEFVIDTDGVLGVIGGTVGVITLVVLICLGVEVSNSTYIDEKINMYTSENQAIEEEVKEAVSSYMEYEGKTVSDIATRSPIALVTLFPELKTDALVGKQIEVYVDNNNKIKELKLNAIDYKVKKWWLYFGG